jgi:predicted ATP-grasp superfamily ATP-dependent carboligase
MFGLKINTAPLMDEAEKIEKRMRGIMEQTKILDRKYRRVGEKGPEVMYG